MYVVSAKTINPRANIAKWIYVYIVKLGVGYNLKINKKILVMDAKNKSGGLVLFFFFLVVQVESRGCMGRLIYDAGAR